MKQNTTTTTGPQLSAFEHIKKTANDGGEYWSARELAKLLGYDEYAEFVKVIERAKLACKNSGHEVDHYFEDTIEVRNLKNGYKRKFGTIKLSRYACYLAIINANPSKETVAKGQTYFLTLAHLQEMSQGEEYQNIVSDAKKRLFLRRQLAKHNIILSSLAKKAGVVQPSDFAVFQNHGYMGLYGGLDAKEVREKKGLAKEQNLLDRMGSIELAANLKRVTKTEEKLKKDGISDKINANHVHFDVGQKVRQSILEDGAQLPEDLPAEADIKDIEKDSRLFTSPT